MSFEPLDVQVYDELVTQAYKIGTGENTAQDFLNFYSAIFPSQCSTIIGHDAQTPDQNIAGYTGVDPAKAVDYAEHFAAIHPYAPMLAKAPPLVIGHGPNFLSDEELYKTEFYNDFLKPNGNISQTYGVAIFKEQTRHLLWSNNYAPQFIEESKVAEATMALLIPHLRRSFELARQLDSHTRDSRTLERALGKMSKPLFICNADMKIQFANSAGEDALLAGRSVTTIQGRLAFSHSPANLKIAQKVKNLAQDDFAPFSLTNDLFVKISLAPLASQFAFITPLPDKNNSKRSIFGTMSNRPILIMLIDPNHKPSTRQDIVQVVFNVTPAEAALACALADGMTPGEYAEARRISKNTARVQTQALLSKMSARRQSDITRMLATAFAGLNFV